MVTPYYDNAGIQIYHGDCREILPVLSGISAIITDPPYGIRFESHGQLFRRSTPVANDDCDWYEYLVSLGVPLAAFYSPYSAPAIKWRSVLVWSKGAHVGIGGDRETCWKRDFELIGVCHNGPLNGGRDSAVISINALSPPPTGHVAEKPEPLMRYLADKMSQPGDLIVDPFMGSGTTLRAAKDLGRRAIGIEIEERYCEIAARRLAQEVLDFS